MFLFVSKSLDFFCPLSYVFFSNIWHFFRTFFHSHINYFSTAQPSRNDGGLTSKIKLWNVQKAKFESSFMQNKLNIRISDKKIRCFYTQFLNNFSFLFSSGGITFYSQWSYDSIAVLVFCLVFHLLLMFVIGKSKGTPLLNLSFQPSFLQLCRCYCCFFIHFHLFTWCQ